MLDKIRKALDAAGYFDDEATEENVIGCYLDYVDAYGGDIDEYREQIADGDITVDVICRALIRHGAA